jgi:DNA modification methylase
MQQKLWEVPDVPGSSVYEEEEILNMAKRIKRERKKRKTENKILSKQEGVEQVLLQPVTDRYKLILGDIAEACQQIEDDSIDVIITDPPYPKEHLPLYGTLAKEASRVLKPGGSLVVMVGQSYLPEVLFLTTPHIRYHWAVSYLTPGGQSAQIWHRKVNTFWKPLLWFVKGEYSGEWIGDVTKSAANDKRFHNWGQSESGMAEIIERFSMPGQTILDPFLGGGTTAVVALELGRYFIGIDQDPVAIQTTLKRLSEPHLFKNY